MRTYWTHDMWRWMRKHIVQYVPEHMWQFVFRANMRCTPMRLKELAASNSRWVRLMREVLFLLFGLVLVFAVLSCFQVVIIMRYPVLTAAVTRAMTARWTLTFGIVGWLVLFALAAIWNAIERIPQLRPVGVIIALVWCVGAFLTMAGWSAIIHSLGDCIADAMHQSQSERMSPLRRVIVGTIVFGLGSMLPLAGWLLFAYWCALSLGAGMRVALAWRKWSIVECQNEPALH